MQDCVSADILCVRYGLQLDHRRKDYKFGFGLTMGD